MTRARDLSRFTHPSAVSVEAGTFNIGIGSDSPDVKLDVIGSIEASGISTFQNNLFVGAGITMLASSGIVSAVSFYGDFYGNGENLTGVASTDNIITDTLAQFNGAVGIADSIFHIGDDNTAIRFPFNDGFTIETNGSERVRVHTSGKVGINTDDFSRDYILTIAESSSAGTQAGIVINDTDGKEFAIRSSSNSLAFRDSTSGNDRLSIDTNGDVSTTEDLQIGTTSSHTKELRFADSTRVDASSILVDNSDSSNLKITNDRSGAAIVFATDSAERARIVAAGGFYIGTNTSSNDNIGGTGYDNIVQINGSNQGEGLKVGNYNNPSRIDIVRNYPEADVTNGDELGFLSFGAGYQTTVQRAEISCHAETTGNRGGQLRIGTADNGSANITERLRVGAGGSIAFNPVNTAINNIKEYGFAQGRTPASGGANSNSTTLSDQKCSTLLFGSLQNTNSEGAHSILLLYDSGGAAVTPGDMIKAYRSTSLRFIVRNDGDCENVNNSYTGISDQRLKQDITDAGSAWDDIKSIRVRKFRFIEEVERHTEHPHLGEAPYLLGVVAQEIETISPGLIRQNKLDDGSPDPDAMKSVKYSILYMKAVKALQEAQTRIETLETTVTTLSDRITALEP